MTQDEIIEMARQAGLEVDGVYFSDTMYRAVLVCFANLVAATEREACAQVAFSWNIEITDKVAEEIRARGEA